MKIFAKVKPNAKVAKIKMIDEAHFDILVKEPAKDGLANEAVLRTLAEIFDISKLRFKIIAGKSSREKIIDIL